MSSINPRTGNTILHKDEIVRSAKTPVGVKPYRRKRELDMVVVIDEIPHEAELKERRPSLIEKVGKALRALSRREQSSQAEAYTDAHLGVKLRAQQALGKAGAPNQSKEQSDATGT